MAVKNLAAAVAQGGRTRSTQFFVRQLNRQVRHGMRARLRAIDARDLNPVDANVDVTRYPGCYMHRDADRTGSLSPLERRMRGMAGREFDEAYAFSCLHDRRTTKGDRLAKSTLDRAVWLSQHDTGIGRYEMGVDADGILCRGEQVTSARAATRNRMPEGGDEGFKRWLDGRAVVDRCGTLCWNRDGVEMPMDASDAETYHRLYGTFQRKARGRIRVGSKLQRWHADT